MKFRYARHTNDLKAIVDFYTQVVGLKVIGSFQNPMISPQSVTFADFDYLACG